MSEDVLEKKPYPFMFDLNNFDEEEDEEDEFEEPPPPTFSEEELATEKTRSFNDGEQKGRADALQESASSREQFVAEQLQVIAQSLPQIFEKEQERERQYEAESVDLCLHLFQKLFPHLHEQHGDETLRATVANILTKQADQKNIIIYTHPDAVQGLEEHLQTLTAQNPKMKITVKAEETINAGACRIDWDDGGAVKNPQALADEIFEMLKDTLAGHGANRHDRSVEEPKPEAESAEAPIPEISEPSEPAQESPEEALNEAQEPEEPIEEGIATPEDNTPEPEMNMDQGTDENANTEPDTDAKQEIEATEEINTAGEDTEEESMEKPDE